MSESVPDRIPDWVDRDPVVTFGLLQEAVEEVIPGVTWFHRVDREGFFSTLGVFVDGQDLGFRVLLDTPLRLDERDLCRLEETGGLVTEDMVRDNGELG